MKKWLVATIFAGLLSACATGTPFKWESARQLKEGMTMQEVTSLMGEPHTVRAEGAVVRYVWVEVNALTFATKTLSVDFVDGKLQKVPPIPDGFK